MNELDLYGPQELLLLSFGAAYLMWLGLSVYVVAARMIDESRRRRLARVEAMVSRENPPSPKTVAAAVRMLTRLPRTTVERAAADASVAKPFARVLASFLVAKRERKLLRAAAGHHSERTRWRRIDALRVLARAKHPGALGLLNRAALDRDSVVAGAAVRILGTLEAPEAADVLLRAMRNETSSSSQIASHLVVFSHAIPSQLRELLRDRDPRIRFWGANLVADDADIGALTQELAALTHDDDPSVRSAAVETLGRISGEAAARAAAGLLADPVPYVRAHAARALGDIHASSSARLVASLLADENYWVRSAAQHALVALGERGVEAAAAYLDHPDRFARNNAAAVLQNSGFIDTLVLEAAGETLPGERTALLEKVVRAGGPSFASATVERLRARPEAQRALARLALAADQPAA